MRILEVVLIAGTEVAVAVILPGCATLVCPFTTPVMGGMPVAVPGCALFCIVGDHALGVFVMGANVAAAMACGSFADEASEPCGRVIPETGVPGIAFGELVAVGFTLFG